MRRVGSTTELSTTRSRVGWTVVALLAFAVLVSVMLAVRADRTQPPDTEITGVVLVADGCHGLLSNRERHRRRVRRRVRRGRYQGLDIVGPVPDSGRVNTDGPGRGAVDGRRAVHRASPHIA